MPDQNQQTNTNPIPPEVDAVEPILPAMPDVATPEIPEVPAPDQTAEPTAEAAPAPADPDGTIGKIINKIADSNNILVALSSDPSVDEISSAIGLSLFLDKLGKRATAIYSGTTPNALEFLKPEETFETSADTLQDFVIAINKEKADHLRYKLDGDYVRIYITPYKSKISKDDLEFSYGDFNVDLVLALNVANGIDLDQALREHGRIMHDATVIDITTGNPGKLGEIEWSDKTSSSVSEMLTRLIYAMGAKEKLGGEEATAFLTGIIAATNRFSAPNTTAETMRIASKLMESGADQQLISKNISGEIENELLGTFSKIIEQKPADPTALDIEHKEEEAPAAEEVPAVEETPVETPVEETPAEAPVEAPAAEPEAPAAEAPEEDNLLQDLKSVEDSLSGAGAEVIPEPTQEPVAVEAPAEEAPTENLADTKETVIAPSPEFAAESTSGTDYGKMLEDALAEVPATPEAPVAPEIPAEPAPEAQINPAASVAPAVASEPDISNLPEINYAADGDMLLPPPPTPPIDFDANSLPTPPAGPAPDMPMPGDMPPDFDPSSFKIPGL